MNQALVIPEPGVLASLNRSDLDGQVAAARQFPRDIELYHARSHSLITRNEMIADECLYALKRDDKVIEGPSVRFAEILMQNWGNCRAGARVIEEGAEFIVAQGIFHDLESNTVTTMETRRRIVDRKGRRYGVDMIAVTANAACAIAYRQAVLKGIPQPFWHDLFQAAKKRAVGSEQDLPQKRRQALEAFKSIKVDEPRVLKALAIDKVEAIGADELAKLRGLYAAIKEGEMSIAEAFPIERQEGMAQPETLEEAMRKRAYGTPPGPDDLQSAADAYQAGREAHAKGAGRTQWPARWRDQAHIEAWLAAWDEAEAEKQPDER